MWNLWLERFEEHLHLYNYSPRTIECYILDTGHFLSYLTQKGISTISEIDRDVIREYQNHLFYFKRGDKGLTLSTQDKKLHGVMAFCRFLTSESYLLYDPALGLHLPKLGKRLPAVILSHSEIKKLLCAPPSHTPIGIRDRAILELLYSTGMRNTELRCLRLRDCDMRRGEMRISFAKGGKSRIVPLGAAAAQYLQQYLEHSRPHLVKGNDEESLFVSCRGKKLSRKHLSTIVQKYAAAAKIRKKTGCHTLRHTCATHMLKGKADIRYIQELLGHKDLATTQIYTKVELSDLKRVHNECHPRNRL